MKAEKLYKGEFSNVYAYKGHLIEVTDPKGWKALWTATNRLTGKVVARSLSLKACMKNVDSHLSAEASNYYHNGI